MSAEKRPKKGELWCVPQLPATFVVTFLMPNGLILDTNCRREDSLTTIKQNLWREAERRVLFRKLANMSDYIFVGVNQESKIEEFYDESKRFCDLGLFMPLLKLIIPVCDIRERIPDVFLSCAVGVSIDELEAIKSDEIISARRNLLSFAKSVVIKRENLSTEARAHYLYPPEIDQTAFLDKDVRKISRQVNCCVWLPWKDSMKQSCTIRTNITNTVSDLIERVLIENLRKNDLTDKEFDAEVKLRKGKYIIKVCGEEQYLFGDRKLYQYKYISSSLMKRKCPQLALVVKSELYKSIVQSTFFMPSLDLSALSLGDPPCEPNRSYTWNYHDTFDLKVHSATYVNVRDVDDIYVKLGLYHGTELLCTPVSTKLIETNPKWDEIVNFDIKVSDIPRSAILSISICSVSNRRKSGEHCLINWGNLPLFDYQGKMISDSVSIHLWPAPSDFSELLNPLGRLGSNSPDMFSPCLEISFRRYSQKPIYYPPNDIVEAFGRQCRHADFVEFRTPKETPFRCVDLARYQRYRPVIPEDHELLAEIIRRDPLSEITIQEKNLVWRMREHCIEIPDSLPKLLESVKWSNREDVAQLYVLLNKWKKVGAEVALELLDCKYADAKVRKLAVGWLEETLSNDMLSSYLLQLVSVLKWERTYDSELARFLLGKALTDRKIGHYFYWHLRVEMDHGDKLRCALILEGYCRGIGVVALRDTIKQKEAIEKLANLNEMLIKQDAKDRSRQLAEALAKEDYRDALENFRSPLAHSTILGSLQISECRVMDSAKKPLWLAWRSRDIAGETSSVIFKSGDDLRQDMLTLQVIKIFDLIWKSEGLDMKMLPYTCLATGKSVGMIEVVGKAKTIMFIQRTRGKMSALQLDATALHRWIKEVADPYDEAIDTFTRSCAGYCVATFILGIGDRNPDNIMITQGGQIFHIDFGHFLGHFKKKLGIARERVPFVLTDDFLYVISRGADNPKKSKEFEAFTELCARAYLKLRRHANLLITLFTMMLSTGIPELQSTDDVGYLRKKLQVERSDEEALKYFNDSFANANGGAWMTKLDWFFHNMAHSY